MLSGWHFFILTFAFVEANLFAKVKAGPPHDEFQRTLEKFSSMQFVCYITHILQLYIVIRGFLSI